jgi:hypothetical protein
MEKEESMMRYDPLVKSSDSPRRKLTRLGGGSSIFPSIAPVALMLFFGSFAFGLVGAALLSGGVRIILRESRLARDGAVAEGTVQKLERTTTSSTSKSGDPLLSSRGEGSHTNVEVYYSYRVNNNRYDGDDFAVFPQDSDLKVGSPVKVRYLPSQPDVSELHRHAGGPIFALMGAVALPCAIGCFFLGLGQRNKPGLLGVRRSADAN